MLQKDIKELNTKPIIEIDISKKSNWNFGVVPIINLRISSNKMNEKIFRKPLKPDDKAEGNAFLFPLISF